MTIRDVENVSPVLTAQESSPQKKPTVPASFFWLEREYTIVQIFKI